MKIQIINKSTGNSHIIEINDITNYNDYLIELLDLDESDSIKVHDYTDRCLGVSNIIDKTDDN